MNTMTDTTPNKESKANDMKAAYAAGVKKAAYAAVGAPVVAVKHVSRMSGSWRKSAKREFEKWVTEGERMTSEIRQGKVVGEIKEKVDFDHLQGRVEKLRDQLEEVLANWRTTFKPDKAAEPEAAVAGAADKKAANRKGTATAKTGTADKADA
jgi:predicted metal-dependent phosphoesterase TrpH